PQDKPSKGGKRERSGDRPESTPKKKGAKESAKKPADSPEKNGAKQNQKPSTDAIRKAPSSKGQLKMVEQKDKKQVGAGSDAVKRGISKENRSQRKMVVEQNEDKTTDGKVSRNGQERPRKKSGTTPNSDSPQNSDQQNGQQRRKKSKERSNEKR